MPTTKTRVSVLSFDAQEAATKTIIKETNPLQISLPMFRTGVFVHPDIRVS